MIAWLCHEIMDLAKQHTGDRWLPMVSACVCLGLMGINFGIFSIEFLSRVYSIHVDVKTLSKPMKLGSMQLNGIAN